MMSEQINDKAVSVSVDEYLTEVYLIFPNNIPVAFCQWTI